MLGWYALCLCIVEENEILVAEDAFDSLDKLKVVRNRTKQFIQQEKGGFVITKENSTEMSEKMLKLIEEGESYKSVGQMFGVTPGAVYSRIVNIAGKRKGEKQCC